MGYGNGWQAMTSKARDYRARAERCERQARKTRDPENREWQAILARAHRTLAEVEIEAAARRQPMAA
jgi:hypothetical protein